MPLSRPLTEESVSEQPLTNLIILHGDEEIAIQKEVHGFIAPLQESGLADFNLSRLDGRSVSLSELQSHTQLLPLGSTQRLVILSHALTMVKSESSQDEFLKLLDHLPPSTQFVMLIPDSQATRRGERYWVNLEKEVWFNQWLKKNTEKVILKHFPLPNEREMARWILQEADCQGGKFEPRAANELAADIGNDTLLVSQEIAKLISYAGNERPVKAEDVRTLSSPVGREDIFRMMDSIAEGDARTALRLLDISLQNQSENAIFPMIVRHFRQLISAAEIVAEGGTASMVQNELKIPSFVAEKLARQAHRFTLKQLDFIYQRLSSLDVQMKDGKTPPELALELFVAELARK